MKGFPIIIQPDSMDCGAASLKMISKYYGKEVNIDKLRELTYLTKDGVSLFSISEAAMILGFKTVGGKISYEKLRKDALLPCIVHWKQNHFVVVYKIRKDVFFKENRVFVVDPAFGKVSYTEDEFKKNWLSTQSNGQEKGVVLLLEPTHDFYSKKK